VRKATKLEKKQNEDKIAALEKAVGEGKAALEALEQQCGDLVVATSNLEADHAKAYAAQDVDYNEKRVFKQKLQFKEHQIIRKKMALEKQCDPNDAFKLGLDQLETEVQEWTADRDSVKKNYDDVMNKQGNVLAKLEYQQKNVSKKLEKKKAEQAELLSKLNELKAAQEEEIYNKDLLIERLKFDTARLQVSIPRLENDLERLDVLKVKFENMNQVKNIYEMA